MDKAYATLMCGGDEYLPGVEALGRSLTESKSEVPRVCLYTPDVSEEARAQLQKEGWALRAIESVAAPDAGAGNIYKRFQNSYTKLRVFELTEYKKLVFIDADALVLNNCDELFDRPSFAAAPDFFMPDRFNSGVMVLEPSAELAKTLIDQVGKLDSYDGGDQGLLNSHYKDWWAMPAANRLEAVYNLHHFVYQFLSAHEGLKKAFIDKVKVIHYTLQKPWQGADVTGGSSIWWDKFYAIHPEAASAFKRKLHSAEDGTFNKFVSMLGGKE